MSVEEILDSVRRIVSRWTFTQAPLLSDAIAGTSIININTTKRFRAGDQVMLRDSTVGEISLTVKGIIDTTHLELSTSIENTWTVSNNSILEKTYYNQRIQNIYLGEPDNIPRFPAITVSATSRNSEWLTIDSTKEAYRVKIVVYVQDSNQEDTYRFLLQVTETIQKGLKNNVFPVVGPYQTASLTADANAGDIYVKVPDTSIFMIPERRRIIIEDLYKAEENRIADILDDTTLRLTDPLVACYKVADSSKVINVSRFIYNSWPDNIEYGTIFKGTLLKAATIEWFAYEEEIQPEMPQDTSLT